MSTKGNKKSTTRYFSTCRANQVVLSWGKTNLQTYYELTVLLLSKRETLLLSTLTHHFNFCLSILTQPSNTSLHLELQMYDNHQYKSIA